MVELREGDPVNVRLSTGWVKSKVAAVSPVGFIDEDGQSHTYNAAGKTWTVPMLPSSRSRARGRSRAR